MRPLYQTQRLMRGIRTAALQRGVVAILDLGTSKVACLVLRFDVAERPHGADGVGPMAGQAQFRVIGHGVTRSRGVRFGEVDSMHETERAIRTAVQAAQKDAQVRVDHVIVCFSGARPESHAMFGEAEVEGTTVTGWDIGRVLASCEAPTSGAPRGAARPARELRAGPPHGARGPAGAGGGAAFGRPPPPCGGRGRHRDAAPLPQALRP
jgi:cell division protein FtsA